MYLKKKIGNLGREAQINKIQMSKSAAIAAKAQKELKSPSSTPGS